MKSILSLLFLCFAIGIMSCSDSSTNSGPGTGITLSIGQAPNVGSWYKFTAIAIDTNGHQVPGSTTWEIDSVVESGLYIAGKSNVIHIRATTEKGGNDSSGVYFHYESNGDVSMLNTTPTDSVWGLLPFASKVPAIKHTDSLINGQPYLADDTIMYIGTESVPVNGRSLTASTVKLSTFSKSTIFGAEYITYVSTSLSFCSSIGYFIHLTSGPINLSTSKIEGDDLTLTSYSVK